MKTVIIMLPASFSIIFVLCSLLLPASSLEGKTFNSLVIYNQEISTIYPEPGIGLLSGEYNIKFEELINYPNGSCLQQSYLVTRQAKILGYDAHMLGLFANTGANDVMVSMEIQGKPYLFVPSAGAYYNHSISELIDNPSLAEGWIGNPPRSELVSNSRALYASPSFFSDLHTVSFYNFNVYETNLLKFSTNSESIHLLPVPHNEEGLLESNKDTYTSSIPGENWQEITYFFDQPQKIYRFYIAWYLENNYARKITIIINDKNTLLFTQNTNALEKNFFPKEQLHDVRKITFRFDDFYPGDTLFMDQLGVY